MTAQKIASRLLCALALCTMLAAPAAAQDADGWRTTTSLIGPSRYQDGFTHYDHVNPDAPKGGVLNEAANGTFDSFNPFIVQGTPAAGLNYQGGLLWDGLMAKAVDEPSASHPLIAKDFRYPDDYSSATYRIDERARWHDGKPITAEDVAWSLEQMKEHSPQFAQYFQNVKEARIDGPLEVTFLFDQTGNRELPLIMSDLPVLPKHWWTEEGKGRDFTKSTLEPPLGSGPYRIVSFSAGKDVTWERVKDYWAADLPVNKGRYNFDTRVYRYFQNPDAIWQAFTKGGLEDVRIENRAQKWAEGYNFPAFEKGDVKREQFADTSSYPFQGWIFNTRLEKFKDRRVRRALTLALDFERMNRDLFFDQYVRTTTYFGGTELSATGLPEGRELEILKEYEADLPPEVFAEPYTLPVYKERSDERKYLREAFDLLKEAGFERRGSALIDPTTSQQMEIVILGFDPSSERVNAPWINALRKLGIDASFRIVDTSQYVARVGAFDYDVASLPSNQSLSPGNEQREYWSSDAAKRDGSRNYAGIADPTIDKLIDRLIAAPDRAELVALTKALDRVLLWGHYAVPQWHLAATRVAWWDKFEVPMPQPEFRGVDLDSWWIDPEKAAALAGRY